MVGYHPGRPPWSAPRGRDLLGGVAVLFVLIALLVVVNRDGTRGASSGAAQPFPRAIVAASTLANVSQWTDVPVARSVVELGPALAEPVASGIGAARTRIERCVAMERRRGPAGAEERHETGPTELVLRLSPRSGAVHVVGVEQRALGRSPVLADCARRHLDGDSFPSSDAVPGRRYRLLVTLE